MDQIQPGTWVEIRQVVLAPEQRAPTLPEDTKGVPYVLLVSGFLVEPAELGGQALVRTMIGRELSGTLVRVNPSYSHSFGNTIPELLRIGRE